MAYNPRSTNRHKREQLRARLTAIYHTCPICGQPLDTSIQGFGDSEVGCGKAGFSRAEIIRLRADQEKTRARAMVEQLRLASAQNRGNETDNETDQQTGTGETPQ